MLGSRAEADEAGGQCAQEREPFEKPADEWKRVAAAGGSSGNHAAMNDDLNRLNQARWPFTVLLDLPEVRQRDRSFFQLRRQQIRGGEGILQGEVDANAAGRRQTTAKEKQHQEEVGKILQSLKPVS